MSDQEDEKPTSPVPTKAKTEALQTKRGPGRPSEYTPERAAAAAMAYAEGMPTQEMGEGNGLPAWSTVNRWAGEHAEFAQLLARAREARGERFAEIGRTSLDITDEELAALDRAASPAVQIRKSRSEYYRWLAGKLSPQYADRTEVHLQGSVDVRGVLGAPLVGGSGRILEGRVVEPDEGDEG